MLHPSVLNHNEILSPLSLYLGIFVLTPTASQPTKTFMELLFSPLYNNKYNLRPSVCLERKKTVKS